MMMMGLHFMKEDSRFTTSTSTAWCATRPAPRCRSRRATWSIRSASSTSTAPTRCASRWPRGAAQGHDIRLGPQDVENNRNFATKLWNAARFAEMNGCATVAGFDPRTAKETLNRWIAHETAKAAAEITAAIADLPLQRGGRRRLSLRLEHLLRLVSRTGEAGAARPRRPGENGNAGRGRLGARRNPEAAAPVHALRHRGIVGRDRPSARNCSRSRRGPRSTVLPTRRPKPKSAGSSISSPPSARCARR